MWKTWLSGTFSAAYLIAAKWLTDFPWKGWKTWCRLNPVEENATVDRTSRLRQSPRGNQLDSASKQASVGRENVAERPLED